MGEPQTDEHLGMFQGHYSWFHNRDPKCILYPLLNFKKGTASQYQGLNPILLHHDSGNTQSPLRDFFLLIVLEDRNVERPNRWKST